MGRGKEHSRTIGSRVTETKISYVVGLGSIWDGSFVNRIHQTRVITC